MKRFYCTICRRVKRVRQYPSNISSSSDVNPMERIGECARHSETPVMKTRPGSIVAKLQNIPVKALQNQNKRRA